MSPLLPVLEFEAAFEEAQGPDFYQEMNMRVQWTLSIYHEIIWFDSCVLTCFHAMHIRWKHAMEMIKE